MNNILSKIGIVVSGCKNGYARLATARIPAGSALPEQGVHDLRQYLRISKPGQQFYALRVLPSALVLTACRSSVDSVGSTGGYIAVSLFVPHGVRVEGASAMLTRLLDAYWGEFIHPVFGSPLPGKLKSAVPVERALEQETACFRLAPVRYRVYAANPGAPAVIVPYDTPATVDSVMANPYPKAYAAYSDVLLVDRNLLLSPEMSCEEGLQRIAAIAERPAEAVDTLLALPRGARYTLRELAVNGVPSTPGSQSLLPADRLSFTLELPDGTNLRRDCTVADAVARKLLLREGGAYRIPVPVLAVRRTIRNLELPARHILGLQAPAAPGVRPQIYLGREEGPDTWSFSVPCDCLPLDLVMVPEHPAKGRHGLVKERAVDFPTLGDTEIILPAKEEKAPPVRKPVTPAVHGARRPGLSRFTSDPATRRTLTLVSIVSGVLLVLIAGGLWWWCSREPEEAPASRGAISALAGDGKQEQPAELSEYIYLVLPVQTQRYIMTADTAKKSAYDYIYTEAFVTEETPRVGTLPDSENRKMKVIRLRRNSLRQIDKNKQLGFADEYGQSIGSMELRSVAPALVNAGPGSKDSVYVALPAAMNMDPSRFAGLDMKAVKDYEPLHLRPELKELPEPEDFLEYEDLGAYEDYVEPEPAPVRKKASKPGKSAKTKSAKSKNPNNSNNSNTPTNRGNTEVAKKVRQ